MAMPAPGLDRWTAADLDRFAALTGAGVLNAAGTDVTGQP